MLRTVAISATLGTLLVGCTADVEPLVESDLGESAYFEGAYATPLELVENPDQMRAEAIEREIAVAVEACMADRGFPDYRQKLHPPPLTRPYGVTDPAIAQVWGYRFPVDSISPEDDPNAGPPVDTSAPDFVVALLGTEESATEEYKGDDGTVIIRYDPDSCYYPSVLAAWPDYLFEFSLWEQLNEIVSRADAEVLQSEEFELALVAWNECVVARGGDSATSAEAIVRNFPGDLTEAEIDAAVTDATCKQESGFLRQWSLLRAQAQHRLVAESPALLEEYLQVQEVQP